MTKPGIHPHLARIRRAVDEHDNVARCTPDADATVLHLGLVDYDSLFVASRDRAVTAMNEMHPLQFLADPAAGFAATWADGFLAGVRFAHLSSNEE